MQYHACRMLRWLATRHRLFGPDLRTQGAHVAVALRRRRAREHHYSKGIHRARQRSSQAWPPMGGGHGGWRRDSARPPPTLPQWNRHRYPAREADRAPHTDRCCGSGGFQQNLHGPTSQDLHLDLHRRFGRLDGHDGLTDGDIGSGQSPCGVLRILAGYSVGFQRVDQAQWNVAINGFVDRPKCRNDRGSRSVDADRPLTATVVGCVAS